MTFRLPLAAALLLTSAAQAQTVPNPGGAAAGSGAGEVISLSPADKEAALAAAAARNQHQTSLFAPPLGAPDLVVVNDGRPHGWVEMMVSSDGSRGIAGSTYIPFGNNGGMSVSVATGRFPGAYGYDGYGGYGGYAAPYPTLRTPIGLNTPRY
jgi:hypothetical protein